MSPHQIGEVSCFILFSLNTAINPLISHIWIFVTSLFSSPLYNVVKITRAMIGRTTHGWRHGKLVVFVLLNVARGLKMFARFNISNYKASKGHEKSLVRTVHKEENGETDS